MINEMLNIPVYRPNLNGNELNYVTKCINSGWVSSRGKYIEEFESNFSKYIKIKNSSTCSNGTVALHLALLALGISEGDNVIVPNFTYIASANSIKYVNANPIFVDVNIDDWTIDINNLNNIIKKHPIRAIIFVNMYGFSGQIDIIKNICLNNNIFLIEDVAEGLGSKINNQFAGSFGDISTFSFFGNKTITTGEGGMVCSNNFELIKRVNYFKSHALSSKYEYEHDDIGYNYRMTNISAAIGCAQLERVDEFIERKIFIANFYKNNLCTKNLRFQIERENEVSSYWMFSFLTKNNLIRDSLRLYLKNNGIETRPTFRQITKMIPYKNDFKYQNSTVISSNGINLPSFPALTKKELVYIVNHVNKFIKNENK